MKKLLNHKRLTDLDADYEGEFQFECIFLISLKLTLKSVKTEDALYGD